MSFGSFSRLLKKGICHAERSERTLQKLDA